MTLSFDELLNRKADASTFIVAGIAVIGVLLLVFLFIKLVKICFTMERQTGRSAYTLIKTILIAAAPTVYTVLALLEIDIDIPFSVFITISIAMFLIVLIWNIKTYHVLGGICFSVVHGVFGALACLGVGMLVFIGIFLIAMVFLGGSSGTSTGSSTSSPSMIRDVNNGMTYHVQKGTNGELYVEDNGRSCILRSSDYSGRYFDDMGNEYVSC